MKLLYFIPLALLCVACQSKPEPVAIAKIPPPPPPRESKQEYWLSHPNIVLLSGKYGVGVDTIMNICKDFNAMYIRKTNPELDYTGRKQKAYFVLPFYSEAEGEGPTPIQSQAFYKEQLAKYGLVSKDISEIINGVYARADLNTPRN